MLDLNRFVRDLCPPLLGRKLRYFKMLLGGARPIYEPDVFMSVEEIPSFEEDVWTSRNWIESQSAFSAVEECGAGCQLDDHLPLNVNASSLLLAALTALQYKDLEKKKYIRILDVGGGLSGGFFPEMLKYLTAMNLDLKYAVLDGALNCEHGHNFFQDQEKIDFFDYQRSGMLSALNFLGSVDVCNFSSTLQYILEWRSVIANVVDVRPSVVAISRTPICDVAVQEAFGIQHVTTSLGYCGRAKIVMIPRALLIAEMDKHGYDCWAEYGVLGDAS